MSKEKTAIDQELIRQLATILHDTDLSEIEIEQPELRIRVARTVSITAPVAPAGAPSPAAGAEAPPPPAERGPHPGTVSSPMVGTAYLAPEPGAPNFVEIGSVVSEGETLMIVEAMKTMNHIPAPRSGRVTTVMVADGQPVEYGEPLLVIE